MHARVSAGPDPARPPPVVLVHGIGVAGRFMVPIAGILATHRQVLAPDLPGFGESGKPARVLNLAELADFLAEWTRALGLGKAAFLGNSFGCQVVVELALRHSGLVERLVLQGPTVDPRARSALRQVVRWARNSRGEHYSQIPISVRDYRRCGARRLIGTFRYALEDRIEEKLPRVRVPALVVRGTRDPIVPQRWAEEAASLLPMGRLAVIPAPHTAIYNAPEELARVVLPFLGEPGRKGTAGG